MNTDCAPSLLPLVLKGSRDYLHGTDIAPALLALAGPAQRVTVQFHRVARVALQACFVGEGELARLRQVDGLYALMRFVDAEGSVRLLAATEAPGQALADRANRIPFDEKALASGATLAGNTLSQALATAATGTELIERIVVLNKSLLDSVAGRTQWLFSRLDLVSSPLQAQALSLRFVRAMGPDTFRSDLGVDGQAAGSIYFTKAAP